MYPESFDIKSLLTDIKYVSFFEVLEDKECIRRKFLCKKGMGCFERFLYIDKGHFTLNATLKTENGSKENISLSAGPDQVVYIPYDFEYESDWAENESSHRYRVNFILKDKSSNPFFLSDRPALIYEGSVLDLKKMFVGMSDLWYQCTPGYQLKCQSIFLDMLYLFSLESVDNYLKTNFRSIIAGIQYLDYNYLDNISTDDLAKKCNVSTSWFRKQFHRYAGVSPVKYRNELRIKKAAELLISGESDISYAAEFIGCNDLPYFNKLFHQFFGMGPREYMKNIREQHRLNK